MLGNAGERIQVFKLWDKETLLSGAVSQKSVAVRGALGMIVGMYATSISAGTPTCTFAGRMAPGAAATADSDAERLKVGLNSIQHTWSAVELVNRGTWCGLAGPTQASGISQFPIPCHDILITYTATGGDTIGLYGWAIVFYA